MEYFPIEPNRRWLARERATREPALFVVRHTRVAIRLGGLFALTIACSTEAPSPGGSTGGQTAGGASGAGVNQVAELVYPQAVDCWNTGFELCEAADDDVGFLTTVVADIESHACIDPKRVYATGISNGAMMAQYLGCREADVFAAVGGIAGGGPDFAITDFKASPFMWEFFERHPLP
jgi:hypothetical protein